MRNDDLARPGIFRKMLQIEIKISAQIIDEWR